MISFFSSPPIFSPAVPDLINVQDALYVDFNTGPGKAHRGNGRRTAPEQRCGRRRGLLFEHCVAETVNSNVIRVVVWGGVGVARY